MGGLGPSEAVRRHGRVKKKQGEGLYEFITILSVPRPPQSVLL